MQDTISLSVGQMAVNCYLVFDPHSKKGIIIDPGDDSDYIGDKVTQKRIQPTAIIATHGHFDHIMAAYALQITYRIPFYIHTDDVFLVKRMRESAKHFLGVSYVDPPPHITSIESTTPEGLAIIHTPGHTPGSICLYAKAAGVVFTGDTIFARGAVGRTDHAYSSQEDLTQSIQKILKLPSQTKLLPGHGEPSAVGEEVSFHVQ